MARTSPRALFSLVCPVVGLSTLIFAGPISSVPAFLGIDGGVLSSYRLRASTVGETGRGTAMAAIISGVSAFGLSWMMILFVHSA